MESHKKYLKWLDEPMVAAKRAVNQEYSIKRDAIEHKDSTQNYTLQDQINGDV